MRREHIGAASAHDQAVIVHVRTPPRQTVTSTKVGKAQVRVAKQELSYAHTPTVEWPTDCAQPPVAAAKFNASRGKFTFIPLR
jgi:hypothetical protein